MNIYKNTRSVRVSVLTTAGVDRLTLAVETNVVGNVTNPVVNDAAIAAGPATTVPSHTTLFPTASPAAAIGHVNVDDWSPKLPVSDIMGPGPRLVTVAARGNDQLCALE